MCCPNVRLDCNILEYVSSTKYLVSILDINMNSRDSDDMLRQMCTLYNRSNKLLCTFHYCSIDVKLVLFRSLDFHEFSLVIIILLL